MSGRSLTDTSAIEERIASKIDPNVTNNLTVSESAGGITFANAGQVMEFAKLMAVSGVAVRKHFRGNPGVCAAVCIQAIEWRMSPYAVANKSYVVNDQVAYEAQLIAAVILQRAPIKGRFKVKYEGEGDKRVCIVWADLRDEPGEIVEYRSPEIGKINPKNSPLWKTDPDQQQYFYSVRALARRHFPDVILGVYSDDELPSSPTQDNYQPTEPTAPRGLASKLEALAAPTIDNDTGELIDDAATADASDAQPDDAQEQPEKPRRSAAKEKPAEEAKKAHPDPVIEEARADGADAAEAGDSRDNVPQQFIDHGEDAVAAWQAGHDSVTQQ